MNLPRKRIAQLIVCLMFETAALGAAELAPDSPFLAANARTTIGAAADRHDPELRGIMAGPDGVQYCIYDPLKKTSSWVGLHELGHAFVVDAADPEREEVHLVTNDGRRLQLALRTAKVPVGPQYAAPAGPDFSKLTPQQAETQIATESMREQMARKRMERLQAIKSGSLPADPPTP
jgi:hypothetical protein